MSAFRYGELFAGAGGLSQGLERAGMSCAFHAELADFPRRVLAHHWPDTPLYGDVTTLDGRELVKRHGPIDLLAGGSPCQDLSVAGKRAGIEGARSGLFYEQIRLWQETGATYLLWENVAGALSSNQYADFAAVLSAIVGGTVPVPSDGWASAGVVAGPAGVAAWRLLDAQWFGVPQRRLRVFVLGARAGGCDPAEVLLEPQGVRRHPPPRREEGEGTAAGASERTTGTLTSNGDAHSGFRDADGLVVSFDWQKGNDVTNRRPSTMNVTKEQTGTLGSTRVPAVLSFGWQNAAAQGDDVTQGSDAPLRTGTTPAVLAFDQHNQDDTGDVVSTVRTNGQNSGAPVVVAFDRPISPTDYQGDTFVPVDGVAMCLPAMGGNNGGGAGQRVVQPPMCVTGDITHALTHEGHDASEDGTGRGTPIVVGSLQAADGKSQFFGAQAVDAGHVLVANAVCAREAKGWNPASSAGNGPVSNGIPRRLMPVECERLMSWPDGWTDIPDEKGKPASDAVRYKACGNGVVSNVSEWIGARLLAVHTAAQEAA